MNRKQALLGQRVIRMIEQANVMKHAQPSFINNGELWAHQDAPVGTEFCGTTGCIAGFTAVAVGWEFKFLHEEYSYEAEDGTVEDEVRWVLYGRNPGRGQDWLPIDDVHSNFDWLQLMEDELGFRKQDMDHIVFNMSEAGALDELRSLVQIALNAEEPVDAPA